MIAADRREKNPRCTSKTNKVFRTRFAFWIRGLNSSVPERTAAPENARGYQTGSMDASEAAICGFPSCPPGASGDGKA